jgi:hypothetical protein
MPGTTRSDVSLLAAVEALIREARAKGLSDDTLLVELEDIVTLLREGLV